MYCLLRPGDDVQVVVGLEGVQHRGEHRQVAGPVLVLHERDERLLPEQAVEDVGEADVERIPLTQRPHLVAERLQASLKPGRVLNGHREIDEARVHILAHVLGVAAASVTLPVLVEAKHRGEAADH